LRIAAFTKYDREAASTRQRFLQYAPFLARADIQIDHSPLLGNQYVRSLVTGERWSRPAVLGAYVQRIIKLLQGPKADLIWIQAELFPYLPTMFDDLVFRGRIPIVYDCDDAVHLKYNESSNRLVRLLLRGKMERLIAGAAAATCGNQLLLRFAAQYCPRTVLLPTVVDIEVYRPLPRTRKELVIGWIGSPTNWENVRPVLPVLREICAETNAKFRAIGAGVRAERDRFPGMELVKWTERSEVSEVQKFDIGIMPLVNAPFERGKSAYKLVQYMACAIPAIASSVGANNSVLSNGCGILANSLTDWSRALRTLLANENLRRELGEHGRVRAVEHYSLQAHAPRLIALFEEVAAHDARKAQPANPRTHL
jgi:glycosyltransferase involved in cell wall biosynthesis